MKETQRTTIDAKRNNGVSQVKSSPKEDIRTRKETQTPRVRRYTEYTPLNVSLTDLYKEVYQIERFPKSNGSPTEGQH